MTDRTDQRAAYIAGLRQLADILDAHPELPLPYEGQSPQYSRLTFNDFLHVENPRAAMAAARRALGVPMEKDDSVNGYFNLKGNLHGLYFTMTALRDAVCERVVIATREVEISEPDPAAVAALPKVTKKVTVEDVEWRCAPILASSENAEVSA